MIEDEKKKAESEEVPASSARTQLPAESVEGDGEPSADAEDQAATPAISFSVVGVGASAGGIEALRSMVGSLTFDNVAIVVILHLSPDRESLLAPILARSSTFNVVNVEDGMALRPNMVYVAPPNADLAILNGKLHLMPPRTSASLPIDYFFRSLAQDQGSRAIGVVLSGAGTDGTLGLRAIKEAGGITFAQDPATATFDSMPKSAIDAGWADFALTPDAIGDQVCDLHRHPYLARRGKISPPNQSALTKILLLIRGAIGTDLTHYKTTTIHRRIERRMAMHKLDRVDDYLRYLHNHPSELRLLYQDILIGVTSFFRDREPFETLSSVVFPAILASQPKGSEIRIWVPACSTGEEAYSIAICLLEFLGPRAADFRLQVFGTDLDENAIHKARRGAYPLNIGLDVSPERLEQFFVLKDGEYHVCRRIRDMVIFSTHNVLKDPPFSRLSLVSCRNLFIYLQPQMQQRVLKVLHYALNPGGFLLLGTSETVGDAPDLFSLLERKAKIYRAKHLPTGTSIDFSMGISPEPVRSGQAPRLKRSAITLASLAEKKLLQMYGPAGVIVNEALDIIHFHGQTAKYLSPSSGAASLSLLKLARPELHIDLRRLVNQAFADDRPVSTECRLKDTEHSRVQLEAIPVNEPESRARCVLVVFNERGSAASGEFTEATPTTPVDSEVEELRRELIQMRQYLQSSIEDLESANEELKSSNEELQSSNEELQSTNEELQTSKEELQSANEELTTVNDELQTRMHDQQLSNDDVHNLLADVNDIVLITNLEFRLRRYTASAEQIMGIGRDETGHRLDMLSSFFRGLPLERIASRVVETLTADQREVACANDRYYLMRMVPYKTLDHTINGVVLTLTDITHRRPADTTGEVENDGKGEHHG